MKILIAGDFCPKDRIANIIQATNGETIMNDIAPIAKRCDFAIVNLECPLMRTSGTPIVKCGPNLKSVPEAVRVLNDSGFSVATLANNHILDYGKDGLDETIKALDILQMKHVGAGKNLKEASDILYIEKGGRKLAIINCCEHEFSIATEDTAGANPLNPIQQWYSIQEAKNNADFVIVIVHGGHEHYQLPSPRMQETYRFFVDAGADVVVNHHQHCYSGYEIYKDRPIFYGLGNFCFDWEGKRNSTWNFGYLLELHIDNKIEFNLQPYEQCNQMPEVHLLDKEQSKHFEEEIIRLNTIIASPQALKEHHEQWMSQGERSWIASLNPFTGRYINALIRYKMLPLLYQRKNLIALLNKVACESHRDKLIYILSK